MAKIAGIKVSEAYNDQYGTSLIVIPTNLYGPNDNFDLTTSHMYHTPTQGARGQHRCAGSEYLGSGSPKHEFLHINNMPSACLHVMKREDFEGMVNIGSSEEISIRRLAELICEVIRYKGRLDFDTCEPDGAPRKLLDVSRLLDIGCVLRSTCATVSVRRMRGLERNARAQLARSA